MPWTAWCQYTCKFCQVDQCLEKYSLSIWAQERDSLDSAAEEVRLPLKTLPKATNTAVWWLCESREHWRKSCIRSSTKISGNSQGGNHVPPGFCTGLTLTPKQQGGARTGLLVAPLTNPWSANPKGNGRSGWWPQDAPAKAWQTGVILDSVGVTLHSNQLPKEKSTWPFQSLHLVPCDSHGWKKNS